MPLALLLLGALAIITAFKGNYSEVGQAFNDDVVNGFAPMLAGITGIGVVFSVIGAPTAGRVFLSLVLVGYFLTNSTAITAIENQLGSLASGGGSGSPTQTPATATQGAQ